MKQEFHVQKRAIVFAIPLVVFLVFIIVLSFTKQGKLDNFSGQLNKKEVAQERTIYILREGKLIEINNGGERIVNDGPFSHLFGFDKSMSSVLVGQGIRKDQDDPYEPIIMNLFAVDTTNRTSEALRQIDRVQDIFYQTSLKRFIILHVPEDGDEGDNQWLTPVTILDNTGNIKNQFTEDRLFTSRVIEGGTIAVHELDDGTLLILKKTDYPYEWTFLTIGSEGERSYRSFRVSDPIDTLLFYNDEPIAYTMFGNTHEAGGRIVRFRDDRTDTLFQHTELVVARQVFDFENETFFLGLIGLDTTNWPPCSRLYKFVNLMTAAEVIGNVSFVKPTKTGLLYGEPIDSCDHIKLWETDRDGMKARLIADDVRLNNGFREPVIIP